MTGDQKEDHLKSPDQLFMSRMNFRWNSRLLSLTQTFSQNYGQGKHRKEGKDYIFNPKTYMCVL